MKTRLQPNEPDYTVVKTLEFKKIKNLFLSVREHLETVSGCWNCDGCREKAREILSELREEDVKR